MPVRSSGRNYSLRRRAESSAGSFDASSTAAHTAVSVSASYYSPLADSSADRQHQAKEDAGEGEEEVVVGGKADRAVSSSTDSGVRVGQSVHNVQQPVGPVSRSASDTPSISTRRARGALPRYVRDTTVVEQQCTPRACSHCCKCHVRHNKNSLSCFVMWYDSDLVVWAEFRFAVWQLTSSDRVPLWPPLITSHLYRSPFVWRWFFSLTSRIDQFKYRP